MQKATFLLLALCAQVILAAKSVVVTYQSGQRSVFYSDKHAKRCICLTPQQVVTIESRYAGSVKTFETADCRGSMTTIPENLVVRVRPPVKSMWFGRPGDPIGEPVYCAHASEI